MRSRLSVLASGQKCCTPSIMVALPISFAPTYRSAIQLVRCIIRLTGKVRGNVASHRTVVWYWRESLIDVSTDISKVTGSIASTLLFSSLNQEVQQLHMTKRTNFSGVSVRVAQPTLPALKQWLLGSGTSYTLANRCTWHMNTMLWVGYLVTTQV